MEISLVLSSIALLLVVINSLTIKVVRNSPSKIDEFVSILIPMRNEEKNIDDCIKSALGQIGLSNFEVIALDDNSSDSTRQQLSKFTSVKVLDGKPLPDSWLGKSWAAHQLAAISGGKYLVFIDADVRLSKFAVASAINAMDKWDFISPYPKQITNGFLQRLFQPLLQWSWLSSVPLLISQQFGVKSMAVANGQFFIVKKDAYLSSGGHKAVKSEVLDDLMLAKQLLKSGFKGGVAEGSNVAECHMYQSGIEMIKGYQKSLWRAFGSIFGTLFIIVILFLSSVLPFVLAISGSETALIGFALIVLSRVVSSLRTGALPNTALLHPFAILILFCLITYSWIGKLTGNLTWRDRSVI